MIFLINDMNLFLKCVTQATCPEPLSFCPLRIALAGPMAFKPRSTQEQVALLKDWEL